MICKSSFHEDRCIRCQNIYLVIVQVDLWTSDNKQPQHSKFMLSLFKTQIHPTDSTDIYISTIVQQSDVPQLPTHLSLPHHLCNRDCEANAAFSLEASHCYHSRGGFVHTGKLY